MLLIISRSKRLAVSLSDTFYYMSILSYPATPKEALSEISTNYHAAIIIEPTSFPDIKDYIERIRSLVREMPIFAISSENSEQLEGVFLQTFTHNTSSPKIAAQIIESCKNLGIRTIGSYKLAGFNASADKVGISYFYSKPTLTKTESMILRYLICSYPIPQSSEAIIRHAFRTTRAPEAASIRTHISAINKKLMKISGRKMIHLAQREGYYIMTPEISESKKIM